MKTYKARFLKSLKRISALLICAALLFGLLPAAFVMNAGALSGLGTAENPYIVTTWDEFDKLMRLDEGRRIYIESSEKISPCR